MPFKTLLVAAALLAVSSCTGTMVEPTPTPYTPDKPKPTDPAEPALLSGTARFSVARASLGQRFTLVVEVKNEGGSLATAVSPLALDQSGSGRVRMVESPSPAAADLNPGESATFTVTLEATDPGTLIAGVAAEGLDTATTAPVTTQWTTLELPVQSPPHLSVDLANAPGSVNVGQTFDVDVFVSNGGESTARLVAPSLRSVSGVQLEMMSQVSPPVAELAAGQSERFTMKVKATSAGGLSLVATALGSDGNDETIQVTSEDFDLAPVTVETPARLDATMAIPTPMTTGQTVTATLTVKNLGSALAKNVLPTPLVPATVTMSGTASATTATTAPTAIDIPGGGVATFTWTYVARGTGAFTLSAGARGEDANSKAAVTAASDTAPAASVLTPSSLVVSSITAPALINPTQPFDLTVTVRNTGGATATGVLPDPMPPSMTRILEAAAAVQQNPIAQDIATGATASFVFKMKENGTGAGALSFTAGARGVDAVSGGALSAVAVGSSQTLVRPGPQLVVEAVRVPAKISRGQTFDGTVQVRNLGGSPATNVKPTLTFSSSGFGDATVVTAPTAVTLASGARTTFTIPLRETGTGVGNLVARAVASGTNPNLGTAVTSPAVNSPAGLVQLPATLTVTTLFIPATVNRGGAFVLGMVVSNFGEAEARAVLPTPLRPTPLVTGGANAVTTSTPVALTVPGLASRTFTWVYRENGTAAGTIGFRGAVAGVDTNSAAALSSASKDSNLAPVATAMGCNGSQLYAGFAGRSLDGDRVDLPAGSDRLRVKTYSALPGEMNRVFGNTPTLITNQQSTYDVQSARWYAEQELSAISLYRAFLAAYQACSTMTATATQYATAPSTTTARMECAAWQRRFWSATPSAAETTACATFATSADNDNPTPRAKWAATCAAVAASAGFLTE